MGLDIRFASVSQIPEEGTMLATIRRTLVGILVVMCASAHGQTFVRVTDPQNQAAVTPGATGYTGCAWVDYDRDGDDDLWVNRNRLYRNDGNGVFVNANIGIITNTGLGSGGSWADYDNDGDPDLYLSGAPNSILYRNDGNDLFTAIEDGDIGYTGHDYRGWSCAWGDYDSDGNVDMVVTHPAGFSGTPIPNMMFRNDGPPNYTFTRITEGDVVTGLAPYTIGSFADFDLDGDQDFNIGTGPVSAPGTDYFYRNMLAETGTADLVQWAGVPLTDTPRDGQNINWIDYDNDGDLDCYVTNYTAGFNGGRVNELYRNEGGEYERVTDGAIVTDRQTSLGNCWADFDNDGWLDCIVANETGTNKYYRNLSDGTFESLTTPFTVAGGFRCPAAGDYDNDGDLDLFITAVGASQGFYRNETSNGNHWLKLKLTGSESNRSAIGAIVRVKAMVDGGSMWQIREVNTQNSFCGHNSLTVHFGLGNAMTADSVEIRWPSGLFEYMTGISSDLTLDVTEGQLSAAEESIAMPSEFQLMAYPNPFNNETVIRYQLNPNARASIQIHDILGRLVIQYSELSHTSGNIRFNAAGLASGTYIATLRNNRDEIQTEPVRLHYLK